jgi:glutamyl-tRNA synthetase
MDELIYKHAVHNAVKHDGKASVGAVIGNVIGERPELKDDVKSLSKAVNDVVKKVNAMSLDEQQKEAEKYPLAQKKEKEKDMFAFLGVTGKVRSAFPPGPEKYPHIGHAKALIINYELAKRYEGEFYLRFEDTNPTLVKKEFYDIMLENFEWLGVKWDKLIYASDYMDLYYDFAKKVLKDGKAYVCICDQAKIKEGRAKSTACECRQKSSKQNLHDFEDMLSGKSHDCIVRLKIDLSHQNTTMRDPTVMRIIEAPHARHVNKYRVWPNYDFQNAIMDGHFETTHRLRSKEFEMRNELQRYIQTLLGFKETFIYEFARFNLEGVEASGRIIREKIQNKELLGWDDPSLTTLVALRRRGFLAKAIWDFVLSTGITKHESRLTWDDLIVHNKRLLDKECNRYFFIEAPQKIHIKGAPQQSLKLKLHPEFPDKGYRLLTTKDEFFITNEDYEHLKDGKLYRLMDCLNFKKESDQFTFESLEHAKFKEHGEKIIHWLPSTETTEIKVLMPDHAVKKGYAESSVKHLPEGTIVQFERFGFCRLDNKEKMVFWFTHK